MATAIETDPMAVMPDEPRNARPFRPPEERLDKPAIADPAPLGLAAMAMTTLVFGMVSAGLLGRDGDVVMVGLAMAYGGLAQLLAGMWELRRGSTFGGLTFTSYGALWLSFGLMDDLLLRHASAATANNSLAIFMMVWGLFTASLWVASWRTTVAVNAMLLLLAATFLLVGIGHAGPFPDLVKVGGWVGIATAATAWYAAFASVINSTFGRTLLPLVPLGSTR